MSSPLSRLETVKEHLKPSMSTIHKSPITCHVLIASLGTPGQGIDVKIEKLDHQGFNTLSTAQTNNDGRCPNLLPSDYKVEKGIYRVTFETQAYFQKLGQACFYPYVQIVFEINQPEQHYHIPLLISPYSYTTYRGS